MSVHQMPSWAIFLGLTGWTLMGWATLVHCLHDLALSRMTKLDTCLSSGLMRSHAPWTLYLSIDGVV